MNIQEHLIDIVQQMERGDYNQARAASLVTVDKESDILTIVSMSETGVDESHYAFKRMAKAMGYSKVN